MGILSGKKALIVGVASKLSIAYGIAEAFAREGAELAFTYQNEKLQPRVEKFAEQWGSKLTFPHHVVVLQYAFGAQVAQGQQRAALVHH